jgi:acyl-CoA dehydrogenase
MVTRLFAGLFAEDGAIAPAGAWREDAWAAVAEAGLPLALLDEDAGGFGLERAEALGLLRIAAASSGALPLTETMLANWLLARAGLAASEGPASVAWGGSLAFADGRLRGAAEAVPWGRTVEVIAVLMPGAVLRVARGGWTVAPGGGVLPREGLTFDAAVERAASDMSVEDLRAAGAAMRVQEMAGALQRVLEMTVRYAGERVQFGKPIGRQQAVQQQLAVLAGQAAAAGGAADIAAGAFARDVPAVAAAKIRAGEAAGIGASIAHQVHGAIGYAAEHRLHLFTTRLWSWRDEFGSERYWSRELGQRALRADGLWDFVTAVGA